MTVRNIHQFRVIIVHAKLTLGRGTCSQRLLVYGVRMSQIRVHYPSNVLIQTVLHSGTSQRSKPCNSSNLCTWFSISQKNRPFSKPSDVQNLIGHPPSGAHRVTLMPMVYMFASCGYTMRRLLHPSFHFRLFYQLCCIIPM